MRRFSLILVLLGCYAFGSCSGQSGQAVTQIPGQYGLQPPAADADPSQSLPGLAELDGLLKAAGAVSVLDVLNPLVQRAISPLDGSLLLNSSGDVLSYALYAVQDVPGIPHYVNCEAHGSLWLLAADYSREHWQIAPFEDNVASIDLRQLGDPYSAGDLIYIALVCPLGSSALAHKLWIDYDEIGEWETAGWLYSHETKTEIYWRTMPVERYEVYRRAGDSPIEFHIGTHLEQGGDWSVWNIFEEDIPDVGGKWVPRMEDHGTPDDPRDDYPAVAPEVSYSYRLVPFIGSCKGPSSPPINFKADWGDRRISRRELPDSTNQTRLFSQNIMPGNLTPAQHEWCAEHYSLALGLTNSDTNAIRVHNPDFISLGQHWAHEAILEWQNNTHGQCIVGDDILPAGFYDRISGYEEWFVHADTSTQYNQRVGITASLEDGYYIDAANPDWHAYLANSLLELMGENHYDGWVLDGAHVNFSNPTDQFWPGEFVASDRDEFWRPRLLAMLEQIMSDTGDSFHRPAPYVIADATYDLDYTPVDGVHLSYFGALSYNSDVYKFLFDEHAAKILEWQNQEKAVLLNLYDNRYARVALFNQYCCYLLLRGPSYYFSISQQYQETAPTWYPEWGWESGLPLDPAPETVDDISFVDAGFGTEYYRRDFENGTVIVIPEGPAAYPELWSPEGETTHYEILEYHGGGYVDADGTVNGYLTWAPARPNDWPGYHLDGPGAWIIRPTLPR